MAKPDLDDGYLRYAHELDAALACADFTKGARIVLREVFSQVFGPARSRTARVFPSELARASGAGKSNLCRAVRELCDSGVLRKISECEYGFVKDYESWTKGRLPRLTPEEISYARLAPSRAMSHKRTSGVNPDTSHRPNRAVFGVNRDTDGVNPDTATVSIQTPNGVNPDTDAHYIERARIETGDRIETSCVEDAGEDVCPDVPPDDGPLMVMPAGYPMGRPDVEDIWRRLWKGWRDPRLCSGFFEHQQWFPADIWRLAISEVAMGRTIPRTIAYFEQRCGDIQINGVRKPPAGIPSAPAAAPSRGIARRSDEQHDDIARRLQERKARHAS